MAEYLTNYDLTTGVTRIKHFSRRVIGGAAETAQPRIAAALGQLDFITRVEENAVRAERVVGNAPRRAGKLKRTPTELHISIKRKSENAVVADFAYAVTDATFYKGDHRSLELEIDSVCALAEQMAASDVCRSCGASLLSAANHAQNRFCPACGAENSFGQTAALEILRLDQENRFAHRLTIGGASLAFTALLAMTAVMFLSSATVLSAPVLVLLAAQFAGWLTLALGIKFSHSALNSPKPKSPTLNEKFSPALAPPTENFGERILAENNNQASEKFKTSENLNAPSVIEETTRHLPSSLFTKD